MTGSPICSSLVTRTVGFSSPWYADVLLSQSCWFDMFACRVAWLAWPPGVGTEQEVLLAAAVSTHLTNTIASQLHRTVAVAQDFHINPGPRSFRA